MRLSDFAMWRRHCTDFVVTLQLLLNIQIEAPIATILLPRASIFFTTINYNVIFFLFTYISGRSLFHPSLCSGRFFTELVGWPIITSEKYRKVMRVEVMGVATEDPPAGHLVVSSHGWTGDP